MPQSESWLRELAYELDAIAMHDMGSERIRRPAPAARCPLYWPVVSLLLFCFSMIGLFRWKEDAATNEEDEGPNIKERLLALFLSSSWTFAACGTALTRGIIGSSSRSSSVFRLRRVHRALHRVVHHRQHAYERGDEPHPQNGQLRT